MNLQRNHYCVSYNFAHHASHSGYDQLNQFATEVIVAKPFSKKIVRHKIMYLLANGVISYDWTSLALETKSASHMLRNRNGIYHILYGERTYHYLGFLNGWRNNHIVATFHQPCNILKDTIQVDWHIRKLSAVICVGRNQYDYFAQIIGDEKVSFIPHGVDTKYYSPPENHDRRQSQLCLFVGDWLRDFPTLRGVIELVSFQRPDVQFIAVTPKKNLTLLGIHPNLTILSNIPDSALLDLYRSATMLVLPCLDATANNALLEAMACGLPVVTTDIGGVRDYANEESAILVPPQDSLSMANAVLTLLDDVGMRRILSTTARQEALKFSWPQIYKQLQTVYQSLD